ncbi:cytochrome P450 [Lysobacter sp. yr284]|uniref:cytochrome P450 n=1 Tax=Lysobacter sp. yr284 TaxID=1761791 RepID=UPI001113702B|nr:cytochrome P450 [Lysobacter sp. yr284]
MEMLRLCPLASEHVRHVLTEHRICLITVLRDDNIAVPVFALHHHENECHGPRKFEPMRWQSTHTSSALILFSAVLETQGDMRIVGEAANGNDALAAIASSRLGVVLSHYDLS